MNANGNSAEFGGATKTRPDETRLSGHFGSVFDADGATLVAAQANDGFMTNGILSFFEQDANDNWTETQTVALELPADVLNLLDPLDVVIDGDRAGLLYNYFDGGYEKVLKLFGKQATGWVEEAEFQLGSAVVPEAIPVRSVR